MRTELRPRDRTVPALLARAGEAFGAKPLLRIGATEWSHADAARHVALRAGALRAAGIAKGDRVALMCGNRVECLETFLACGWIGAIAVPINTASMGPQIEYLLVNSGAKLLVIEDAFAERLSNVDLSRTALRSRWILDRDTVAPAEPVEAEAVLTGDTLAILYTSGTTGPAKGVMCPHAQYAWWGLNTGRILDVTSADVLCTTLPLFHINALNTFAQALVTGACVAYEPKFSASGFWAAMRRNEATVVYLLGAMVPILLAQAEGEEERKHRVRIGLGPGVPAAASAAFRSRTGVALLEGYGSTETNFALATTGAAVPAGSMGRVQPGFHARVVDEQDNELPAGEAGELVLRADEPFAFATGYFGMPEKTVEAWRNLWFHTGDRVVRDVDGTFRFVDRIKDAIRRRGENISSYEVEQVLLSHPGVAEAAVFPVRSDLAEDEVMVAIVPRAPQGPIDVAELWEFCETRLPKFAIPRYVDVVPDLPRTENGKVQKYRLRERGVTASTRDRTTA